MFSKEELIEEMYDYDETINVQLPPEDIFTITPILIRNGYAVCLTDGDFGDKLKLQAIYAGDIDNLDYANSNNIVFTHRDILDMLVFGEYKENVTEDVTENCEVE